jgi:hypothetical protein
MAPVFGPIGARRERRTWTGLRDHLEAAGNAPSVLGRYMPDFDVRESHTRLMEADVVAVRAAITDTDFAAAPVVRALLLLRALPGRLVSRLGGNAEPVPPPFTLADMPQAGWTVLTEDEREIALATLTHPWRIGREDPLRVDREAFAAFSAPGYAKIAFSIRADSYDQCRTQVTTETRVVTTDPTSRKRFARYWVVVGPLSAFIRRVALRRIATHVEHEGREGTERRSMVGSS